jgi:hypothetical protein
MDMFIAPQNPSSRCRCHPYLTGARNHVGHIIFVPRRIENGVALAHGLKVRAPDFHRLALGPLFLVGILQEGTAEGRCQCMREKRNATAREGNVVPAISKSGARRWLLDIPKPCGSEEALRLPNLER